jgi:hypothetical protein
MQFDLSVWVGTYVNLCCKALKPIDSLVSPTYIDTLLSCWIFWGFQNDKKMFSHHLPSMNKITHQTMSSFHRLDLLSVVMRHILDFFPLSKPNSCESLSWHAGSIGWFHVFRSFISTYNQWINNWKNCNFVCQHHNYICKQGCQILLGPNISKREKYTKWPQTIPNGHELYKMAVKYTNNFHSKAIQNILKFFCLKINHLATLYVRSHGGIARLIWCS